LYGSRARVALTSFGGMKASAEMLRMPMISVLNASPAWPYAARAMKIFSGSWNCGRSEKRCGQTKGSHSSSSIACWHRSHTNSRLTNFMIGRPLYVALMISRHADVVISGVDAMISTAFITSMTSGPLKIESFLKKCASSTSPIMHPNDRAACHFFCLCTESVSNLQDPRLFNCPLPLPHSSLSLT